MERDKQIEEMAKHCTYYHNGECFACANHPTECDLMCEMFGVFANLVMADYRKDSEVALEVIGKVEKIIDKYYNRHIFGVEELSDVEQEAVMNFSGDVTYDIAELKKKYAEGEG